MIIVQGLGETLNLRFSVQGFPDHLDIHMYTYAYKIWNMQYPGVQEFDDIRGEMNRVSLALRGGLGCEKLMLNLTPLTPKP